jgi:tetrapyrrole methylase family protein/MazG family protein
MSKRFQKLVKVMGRLRGRKGCPWDKEQTRDSLKPFLIEEAHEVLEAIEDGDAEVLKEELGDLLFQVIFHAQIARERGEFDIGDVLKTLTDKMVRRHPHVFGTIRAGTSKEVLARWEKLKHQEHRHRKRKSVLDGVPRSLPALMRAHQLQGRAARVGFDWSEIKPVWGKVQEEMKELEASYREGDAKAVEAEMGDLLFALVNLSRFVKINPEDALRKANHRFLERFHYIEKKAKRSGRALSDMTLSEMDRLWEEAKARVKR